MFIIFTKFPQMCINLFNYSNFFNEISKKIADFNSI